MRSSSGFLKEVTEKDVKFGTFPLQRYTFKAIENYAIRGLNKLTYLHLKTDSNTNKLGDLTTIGSMAISFCPNLRKIKMSGSVKILRKNSFYNNPRLQNIQLATGLETIDDEAFFCCDIREIYIPDSVTYIGKDVFWGNRKIHTIHLCGKAFYVKCIDNEIFIDPKKMPKLCKDGPVTWDSVKDSVMAKYKDAIHAEKMEARRKENEAKHVERMFNAEANRNKFDRLHRSKGPR